METHRDRSFADYAPPVTPIGAIVPATRLQLAMAIVKTVSILGVAVAAIFTAGIFWSSYRDLPRRTEQNQINIATLKTSVDSVRSEMREVKTLLAQSLCMQKAEKLHLDWQSCFIQAGPLSVIGARAP